MVTKKKPDREINITFQPGKIEHSMDNSMRHIRYGVSDADMMDVETDAVGSYTIAANMRKHIFALYIQVTNTLIESDEVNTWRKYFDIYADISSWLYYDIRHAKSVEIVLTHKNSMIKASVQAGTSHIKLIPRENGSKGLHISFKNSDKGYMLKTKCIDKLFKGAFNSSDEPFMDAKLIFKF